MREKLLFWVIVSILSISTIVILLISGEISIERKDPIKIGITIWSGDAHAFLAQNKGIFEKNGVQIKLVFSEQYSEIEQKYRSGELDGIFTTLTDVIKLNIDGKDSQVIYVTDYSNDADVIVGSGALVSDLKGKTVSSEDTDGYSRIFVLKALEKSGLSENDVKFVNIPAHEVLSALERGEIDAGHTWEPTKSKAAAAGYSVLFSGGQIPGTITSTLAFNSEIIVKRPDDVMAIVKSMVEAQEYRDTNWDESMAIMADAEGLTVIEMSSGFAGMNTLDLVENKFAFTKSNSTESLYQSGAYIIDYYKKIGKLTNHTIDNAVEPKFIHNLAK